MTNNRKSGQWVRSPYRVSLHSRFIFVIVVGCALAVPCGADQSSSKAKKRPKPAPAPVVQPAAPPVVLSPEQMPAVPPQVTFSAGQLIINAPNSTLGDVLRAVRKQTGAAVDVPGNATERVVGRFGPGAPRDVLASLLNGSHFNYVLLGSATNPYGLDRVILTSRSGGDVQPASTQIAQQNQPGQSQASEETIDSAFEDAPDAQQQGADIFGTDDQAGQGQPAEEQQTPFGQQANPFGQQPANVRTPEQLLQDLQQRQQQMQQQMQQGLPPGSPGFPPGLPRPPQPQPQ